MGSWPTHNHNHLISLKNLPGWKVSHLTQKLKHQYIILLLFIILLTVFTITSRVFRLNWKTKKNIWEKNTYLRDTANNPIDWLDPHLALKWLPNLQYLKYRCNNKYSRPILPLEVWNSIWNRIKLLVLLVIICKLYSWYRCD